MATEQHYGIHIFCCHLHAYDLAAMCVGDCVMPVMPHINGRFVCITRPKCNKRSTIS